MVEEKEIESKFTICIFPEVELESIQERYLQILRTYLQHMYPQNFDSRLNEILAHVPDVSYKFFFLNLLLMIEGSSLFRLDL